MSSADPPAHGPVVAVSSNKGGVGKTTLVANLAVYVRALWEDLPVLVLSLDDQNVIDRMFSLPGSDPVLGNVKHAWARRSFEDVIQLGNFGVHFVPSPPDTALLKARSEDLRTLSRILVRTGWKGLTLIDTKSDLEALTLNALQAADRILVPVMDWASLEEAAKTFAWLGRKGIPRDRARVVFTLVDRRTRIGREGDLFARLRDEVVRRGWPRYDTFLSRSPRVEALNSSSEVPRTILHAARATQVHQQMRELTEELMLDLDVEPSARESRPTPAVALGAQRRAAGVTEWKTALFRALGNNKKGTAG